MSSGETCAVCGRTILAGERVRSYMSPSGELRAVCPLCRDRASKLGWVDPTAAEASDGPDARKAVDDPVTWDVDVDLAAPPANADPAARGANVGRQVKPQAAPAETIGGRLQRALDRFNASEVSRTVAGLMRTLGQPWVSIGAVAGSPSEIRITVAWELSWYQWGVDLSDELRPVFQLDKGDELDELDGSARQWNASAQVGGKLSLGAAIAGRARDGESRPQSHITVESTL